MNVGSGTGGRPTRSSVAVRPLHRLGQNFLVDGAVRDRLVRFAELSRSDTVLEVGPGTGFLTDALIALAGRVVAIEKDRLLVRILRSRYQRNRRLKIVEGDVLRVRLPRFDKVVSCPPYCISSRLVLLLLSKRFRRTVLVLQKEFAERLSASSGSPDYGRISVMVQHKASVEILGTVHRGSFRPAPKVDSAIVVIQKKKSDVCVRNGRLFGDLVRFLFTQRRKKAGKVLRQYLEAAGQGKFAKSIGSSIGSSRVFQLTVSDFERLSNEIDELCHLCNQ